MSSMVTWRDPNIVRIRQGAGGAAEESKPVAEERMHRLGRRGRGRGDMKGHSSGGTGGKRQRQQEVGKHKDHRDGGGGSHRNQYQAANREG